MVSKSSRTWLREHFTDPFVKQAQKEGYRSRSVYKLQEIHEHDRLFKPGMTVVDLGAAPGGWCQLLTKLVMPKGRIIALDILPMDEMEGVDFIQGDFSEDTVLNKLTEKLKNTKVDWVVSDMAPNMSGHLTVDVPRAMYLCELALDFALSFLKPQGGFLIKVFQGEGTEAFYVALRRHFKSVVTRKPKASRGRSREIYILARGLKPTGA